jgi:hypothetical protein
MSDTSYRATEMTVESDAIKWASSNPARRHEYFAALGYATSWGIEGHTNHNSRVIVYVDPELGTPVIDCTYSWDDEGGCPPITNSMVKASFFMRGTWNSEEVQFDFNS